MVEQDYRFRQGLATMTFVNFSLLVLTASDKIEKLIPIPTLLLLAIMIPSGFVGVWLFGYVLDVYIKYPHLSANVAQERTPWLKDIIDRLERIEQKVEP
jgi:hypothetical protein